MSQGQAASSFKLLLGIKQLTSNGQNSSSESVHFKVDGGRFDSERTIKLNVEASYGLQFTFRPAQTILSLNIEGANVVPEQNARDADHCVYTAAWSTIGFSQHKSGNRKRIPVVIELANVGSLTVTLQAKLYAANEKSHSHWGSVVNHIEYECSLPQHSSFIDITKETFR